MSLLGREMEASSAPFSGDSSATARQSLSQKTSSSPEVSETQAQRSRDRDKKDLTAVVLPNPAVAATTVRGREEMPLSSLSTRGRS